VKGGNCPKACLCVRPPDDLEGSIDQKNDEYCMRVVGGSPGDLAERLREARARTPPDKGYKGLTASSSINTTLKTPLYTLCCVPFLDALSIAWCDNNTRTICRQNMPIACLSPAYHLHTVSIPSRSPPLGKPNNFCQKLCEIVTLSLPCWGHLSLRFSRLNRDHTPGKSGNGHGNNY
jgi:hypothetical protein